MVAQILQSGQATLNELRTIYSLEDMYSMWEVVYVEVYNQWKVNEYRKTQQKVRNMMR